jgi:hypothetical protein
VTGQPYSFEQARAAAAAASAGQLAAERAMKEAAVDFAQKEERYRVALAKEIVRQHAEDKVAWTVAPDLARGNPDVARLRMLRDVAEGVRDASQQAAWRRAADRKDTQRFIDWSARREIAEGYGNAPEPEFDSPIGGRR